MRARAAWGWIAAIGVLLACGGCGFKGPLYLPERNATVVTHPPQAAQPAPAVRPALATQGAPPAGQAQTPAGKSKGKAPAPSGSPPQGPPQSPPPPQ
ncbi:MAG: lipoprotein [Gammaproteobacteria bacterium]|nr:lipoprotein [Gammaproteobacteria bacterium]MDE2264163.1 lipoprotein [Gammaproteobacteria bacterium]